jgi:hypothetical protein
MNTLSEGFPCFFLSCKANARVKPAVTLPNFCVVLCICFVSFSVLFVCKCVLYYCQRVATQLQLNISYHKCQNLDRNSFHRLAVPGNAVPEETLHTNYRRLHPEMKFHRYAPSLSETLFDQSVPCTVP